MATYSFSQAKGTSIAFNTRADILNFDIGCAADVDITLSGTNLIFTLGAWSVTLLNVGNIGALATSNITFADGSRLLIGDNTTGTSNDSRANNLAGGAGNDQLIGLGGNDTLDGREGSDTYVVTGINDGTDIYRDTGTTGIDRIVAGANGAIIRLETGFSNSLTGIDAIVGNITNDINGNLISNKVGLFAATSRFGPPQAAQTPTAPVELKPGGYHVMLMDLKAALSADSTVPMTLTFVDAKGNKSTQELKLPVKAMMSHAHHKH